MMELYSILGSSRKFEAKGDSCPQSCVNPVRNLASQSSLTLALPQIARCIAASAPHGAL
jgi:hypothetical protein